ncbi:hypothetical protein C1H76_4690 [Elsinoe australis]|uniref:Uncharacterized protein n=1 Tax=Elsinoe australis TaxID=40998 RepID=A0A4V6DU41_9PEZI|nr:hypothetical protein C1H76_4690 [Elsinoe australis]
MDSSICSLEQRPRQEHKASTSLWSLPKEIRERIFLFTCEHPDPDYISQNDNWIPLYHFKTRGIFTWTSILNFKDEVRSRRSLLALMQTCSKVYHEVRPLLYRNTWGDFEELQGPKRLRELTTHATPNWMTGISMTIDVNPQLVTYFTTLMDKLEWGVHIRFLDLGFAYPDWTRGYLCQDVKEAYWYGDTEVATIRDEELAVVLRSVLDLWPKVEVHERVAVGFCSGVEDMTKKWNDIFWGKSSADPLLQYQADTITDAEDRRIKNSPAYKYKEQTRREAADEREEKTGGLSCWHHYDYWSNWDKYGNLKGSRGNSRRHG